MEFIIEHTWACRVALKNEMPQSFEYKFIIAHYNYNGEQLQWEDSSNHTFTLPDQNLLVQENSCASCKCLRKYRIDSSFGDSKLENSRITDVIPEISIHQTPRFLFLTPRDQRYPIRIVSTRSKKNIKTIHRPWSLPTTNIYGYNTGSADIVTVILVTYDNRF
jgi:hypothetical protein